MGESGRRLVPNEIMRNRTFGISVVPVVARIPVGPIVAIRFVVRARHVTAVGLRQEFALEHSRAVEPTGAPVRALVGARVAGEHAIPLLEGIGHYLTLVGYCSCSCTSST